MWRKYKQIPLLKKMLAAMLLGIVIGLIFGEKAAILQPLGTLFLTLLQMIAMPLVIFNLLGGITSLEDPKLFGKIGGKTLLYFAATTLMSMGVALLIANIIRPGVGFVLEGEYAGTVAELPSLSSAVLALFTTNVFSSLSEGKYDQICIFVAFLGVAILFLQKEQRERVASFCQIFSNAMSKIMGAVMLYAPIGICALMARTIGTYGSVLLGPAIKYIISIYASIFAVLILYVVLLLVFSRVSPLYFFKKAAPLIVSAVSTLSSIACLPVGMECAEDMDVPKGIYSFTLPLGNQLNRNGMAMLLVITFMFTAQSVGTTFDPGTLLRMIFLGLILSTGGGGVPGGAMAFLAIILDTFGLPLEIVGLISGIHTINEMGLTTMNVLGDLVGTVIISKGRGSSDEALSTNR